jgi:hypothetical protein
VNEVKDKKRSLRKISIGLLMALAILFLYAKPVQKYQEAKAKENLLATIKTNWPDLVILTNIDSPDFFTPEWRSAFVNAKASRVDEWNLLRALSILVQELSKYPKTVINNELKAVAICSTLSLYNIHYGGTNTDNRIYLTVLSVAKGYTEEYIRRTINHEFSSILIRDHKFPVEQWMATLPTGVKYADSIEQEVRIINAGRNQSLADENELRSGFVADYGTTNYENDVNTYAEMLFTAPVELKALAQRYPAIEAKYVLLANFYKGLDSGFHWPF